MLSMAELAKAKADRDALTLALQDIVAAYQGVLSLDDLAAARSAISAHGSKQDTKPFDMGSV